MRAPLSVIIPTLDAEMALPACLGALYEGVEAGLLRELIVSDGGSEDATLEIADEAGAEIVTGASSRGGQLRRGCTAAKGEWLLVVHADTVLQPGWTEAVLAHFADRRDKAGYFRLAFDHKSSAARRVAGWANLRSGVFGLPYGDQGLLIRRRVYDEIGGYEDVPLMEDVALARRLKGRLVALDGVAMTSADKYVAQGWLRRGGRNLWTLARYFLGVSPETLSRAYRK